MGHEEDDNIPTLHDVLRPGDGAPARRTDETSDADRAHDDAPLTEAEIETVAAQVSGFSEDRLRGWQSQAESRAAD